MALHRIGEFDEEKFELENAVRVLEEAREIQADPDFMQKIETHLKEQQTNFQEIERQLFGSDESTDDSTD